MKKKTITEADAPAAAPTTTNIGQEFAQAKKTIGAFLSKLGQAFNEYETRLGRLNMALQRQMAPLAAGAQGASDRIKQLEDDYAKLEQDSAEALRKANETITDLKRQLKDAMASGSSQGEQLRMANQELQRAEQTIADKQQAIEAYIERLSKAKDRIRAAAGAHETDRVQWNQQMDAYEQQIDELRKKNEELVKLADDAVARFNELLAGTTRTVDQAHTKHYGGFDLKEHLERARKKQGVTETWF